MDDAKVRARMAAELRSLLEDEKAHVERFKRIRGVIRWSGIGCIVIAVFFVGTPLHWSTTGAAILGLIGGFLGGLSIAYDTSLQSWPVIKPLLKDNALELLGEPASAVAKG